MWRINSVEEITTTTTQSITDEEDVEEDDADYHISIYGYPSLALNLNPLKVPFPEAGIDIIDTTIVNDYQLDNRLTQECGVKCYDCHNWEQNWFFRKSKRTDNKSDIMLTYMAMIIAELPVCMLIPNPIDNVYRPVIGDRDVDELSDLSEHNSVGSLDFSSDSDSDVDEEMGETTRDLIHVTNQVSNPEECHNNRVEPKIMTAISVTSSDTNGNHELLSNQSKAIKSIAKPKQVVVVDNRVKPIVKTVTKVPNYLPKELRVANKSCESDPYLVWTPGDACVQSGITIQFICRARGSKPLLYSWFKNDTILKTDNQFHIFQSGEESILEIMNTNANYSDQYSCVVYNRFGYQWCDFTLQVSDNNFMSHQTNHHKMPIKMPAVKTTDNQLVESKPETVSSVEPEICKTTTNPKHAKRKTGRPVVIQRTWADRVAEINSKAQNNQSNESNNGINGQKTSDDSDEDIENISVSSPPMPCPIAEREHKKWEHPDIQLKDSPYSAENLNSRLQQRVLSITSLNESVNDKTTDDNNEDNEDEVDSTFLSTNSKDLSRYQKDYYVKQPLNKEETLRSFDENEYSNTKYFVLKQIQRKSSEDIMSQVSAETSISKTSNETDGDLFVSDSAADSTLPSVKDLVSRFSCSEQQNDKIPKLVDIKRKNSFSDSKFNQNSPKNGLQTNNFKVHSLTARSMTKEFRQMSQVNLPRTQRNRMDTNGHKRPVSLIESESSSASTPCSPTNEEYASDESNTSSVQSSCGQRLNIPIDNNNVNHNGNNNNDDKQQGKFSTSILKRASYWQKRCEQGLISDCSVNEDFPPMETIAK